MPNITKVAVEQGAELVIKDDQRKKDFEKEAEGKGDTNHRPSTKYFWVFATH